MMRLPSTICDWIVVANDAIIVAMPPSTKLSVNENVSSVSAFTVIGRFENTSTQFASVRLRSASIAATR